MNYSELKINQKINIKSHCEIVTRIHGLSILGRVIFCNYDPRRFGTETRLPIQTGKGYTI
jgi:hypothetical protein